MKPTRVFIVDDHPPVREWLGHLFNLQADMKVCGEAGDAAAALSAMAVDPPDVAVVDLTLQRGSGLDLIRDLRARLPETRVVVLSMHEEVSDVERAFRAGATGYVMKRESTLRIIEAVQAVRQGILFANPEVMARLAARLLDKPSGGTSASLDLLSDRELDVFRRLGAGSSTRQIAEDLGLSLKTVQTYCMRIKEKLGLGDAAELARVAYRSQSGAGD
jgi:DNA-binding NarL/FixJ family response regulator